MALLFWWLKARGCRRFGASDPQRLLRSPRMSDSKRLSDPEVPRRISRASAGLVVLVWFASFPFVLHYAGLAWRASSNRVEDWIPSGRPETRELDRFNALFTSGEVLVVSWPGCTLDDPRLERLRRWADRPESEMQDDAAAAIDSGGALGARLRHSFNAILTGQDLLDNLERWPGPGLSARQKQARLQGWFLGPGGRTTLAIALLSEAGIDDRQAAVDVMRDAAVEATGLDLDQLHLAGSTVESVATDEANRESLERLTLLSFVISFCILLIGYRNLRVSLLLLGIAIFNQQLSLAVVGWTGGRVDAVLLLMASVMFVLSISAGCHFLRYFREALIQFGPAAAPGKALGEAIRPAALAAFTSAIGFGSLATSHVVPVQNFGIYAAGMVMVCGVTVPALILVSFILLPPHRWHRSIVTGDPEASDTDAEDLAQPSRLFTGIATVSTYWPWVIAASLLILFVTLAGLPRLQTALGIFQMFPDDAKVLADYRWIEENVAPLVPIEVTITVPRPQDIDDTRERDAWIEELGLVRDVASALRQMEQVESVVSTLNFIPTPPFKGSGTRHVLAKRAFASGMRQSAETLAATGFFRSQPDARHWRVSGRVKSSAEHDYAELNREVETAVASVIRSEGSPQGAMHEISGGAIVFDRMQRRLLVDMGLSFLTAIGLIAVVMTVILRSVRAGLATMLPNLMPPVLLFGVMGWLNSPIEIGSVLTASVAVGIAVDDSLHLIHAYKRSQRGSRSEAIVDALQHCGPAMIQTSVVCSLGMLVFVFSPFLPIARFAWVIATLLAMALLGDLLVLPSILNSPAGNRVR